MRNDKDIAHKQRHTKIFVYLTIILFTASIFGYALSSGRTSSSTSANFIITDMQKASYNYASQIPKVLEQVKCWCGCDKHPPYHKNLRQCFIDDSGAFDSHGAGCELCMAEAIDAYSWYKEGYTPEQISKMIDEKYGR